MSATNDGSGSSERTASQFMSQGRPAPDGLQVSGARPGDQTMALEIKTPQVGRGFVEWAIKGYSMDGDIMTSGMSNRDPETPGKIADVKTNIPVPTKEK